MQYHLKATIRSGSGTMHASIAIQLLPFVATRQAMTTFPRPAEMRTRLNNEIQNRPPDSYFVMKIYKIIYFFANESIQK